MLGPVVLTNITKRVPKFMFNTAFIVSLLICRAIKSTLMGSTFYKYTYCTDIHLALTYPEILWPSIDASIACVWPHIVKYCTYEVHPLLNACDPCAHVTLIWHIIGTNVDTSSQAMKSHLSWVQSCNKSTVCILKSVLHFNVYMFQNAPDSRNGHSMPVSFHYLTLLQFPLHYHLE